MREILFRGKRLDNGEWVEGFYCKYKFSNVVPIAERHYIMPMWVNSLIEVDPETAGQFTGLYDKNGKQIFENDIVKFKEAERFTEDEEPCESPNITTGKGVVKYKDGAFYPRPYRWDCGDHWYSHGIFDVEVIGNIHDNPELLEITL